MSVPMRGIVVAAVIDIADVAEKYLVYNSDIFSL